MAPQDRALRHGREVSFIEGEGEGLVDDSIPVGFPYLGQFVDHDLLRSPGLRPDLGSVDGRLKMADLLLFAFTGKENLLTPPGD